MLCADAHKDETGSIRIIHHRKWIALIMKRLSVRSYFITLLGFMQYKKLTSSFFWAFLFSYWWKVFLSCFMLKWVSQLFISRLYILMFSRVTYFYRTCEFYDLGNDMYLTNFCPYETFFFWFGDQPVDKTFLFIF